MKNKIFQLVTGSMMAFLILFAVGCSKSQDQVKDDNIFATTDDSTAVADNLGAGSTGRGR